MSLFLSTTDSDLILAQGTPTLNSILNINVRKRLIFKSSENEPGVDLLKIPGTKDKANLYATIILQLMYTMEELVALQRTDIYNDNRYKLIKDALTYLTKLGYNQNQYNSTSKLPRSRSSSSSIIGVYQKPFGLIGTGQFNKPTKELLTKSRW
ncbi:unnamed protein product, partial [Rotaria sp. Silwood1]